MDRNGIGQNTVNALNQNLQSGEAELDGPNVQRSMGEAAIKGGSKAALGEIADVEDHNQSPNTENVTLNQDILIPVEDKSKEGTGDTQNPIDATEEAIDKTDGNLAEAARELAGQIGSNEANLSKIYEQIQGKRKFNESGTSGDKK